MSDRLDSSESLVDLMISDCLFLVSGEDEVTGCLVSEGRYWFYFPSYYFRESHLGYWFRSGRLVLRDAGVPYRSSEASSFS